MHSVLMALLLLLLVLVLLLVLLLLLYLPKDALRGCLTLCGPLPWLTPDAIALLDGALCTELGLFMSVLLLWISSSLTFSS